MEILIPDLITKILHLGEVIKMNDKIILGLFALLIVGIFGAGLVSAHFSGSYGGYSAEMHSEIDQVFETGTFNDLEALREEYQMPFMFWIDSEEDFELAQQQHEKYEGNDFGMMGSRGMPCHGWN